MTYFRTGRSVVLNNPVNNNNDFNLDPSGGLEFNDDGELRIRINDGLQFNDDGELSVVPVNNLVQYYFRIVRQGTVPTGNVFAIAGEDNLSTRSYPIYNNGRIVRISALSANRLGNAFYGSNINISTLIDGFNTPILAARTINGIDTYVTVIPNLNVPVVQGSTLGLNLNQSATNISLTVII